MSLDTGINQQYRRSQVFVLHPQLEKDWEWVGDLPLSRLLLMNDSQYPWLIQVPRRAGITEISD